MPKAQLASGLGFGLSVGGLGLKVFWRLVYTCVYIYMFVYVYVCICVYIYIHMCVCLHIYVYTHMHACIHTYIHYEQEVRPEEMIDASMGKLSSYSGSTVVSATPVLRNS